MQRPRTSPGELALASSPLEPLPSGCDWGGNAAATASTGPRGALAQLEKYAEPEAFSGPGKRMTSSALFQDEAEFNQTGAHAALLPAERGGHGLHGLAAFVPR